MRITQNMIYDRSLLYMNNSLSRLAALEEQTASEKRINRPSDDPAGYFEARELSTSIREIRQYADNAGTAKGWLNLADATLLQASTILTSIQEKAQQAATGTLNATDRQNVVTEVRQLFKELLSLANVDFNGSSIFGGQKTDGPAFVAALYASVTDETLGQEAVVSVTGASEKSVLVQFTDSGTVGGGTDLGYRYSRDGGETWTDATLAAGETALDLDGCVLNLANGSAVTASTDETAGTVFTVRPSALYMGDDQDGGTVRAFGNSPVTATADGVFSSNVQVRIDSNATLSGTVSYSYSLDGGSHWVGGNQASGASLPVPGGFLTLASNGGSSLNAGDQFAIIPNTADISLQISPSGEIVINNVGKDVFGGLYQSSGSSNASPVSAGSPSKNIFEVVGDLIGRLETNDMDGVGADIEALKTAHEHLESAAADVGAREIRLEFAKKSLGDLEDSSVTRLSAVEDADLSQLLIDLSKYQYIYQSVLSVSSQIMGMSMLKYF